jgi:small-conductance mechanosensitive channel
MPFTIPPDFTSLIAVYSGKVALAIAILVIFWLGGRTSRAVIQRVGRRDVSRVDLYDVLGSAASLTVIGFGVMSALGTVGVDVTAVIAGVGIVGVALGFALKDIVSNFTAGVMIITFRPLVRGDVVEVSGAKGEVMAIDLRNTHLRGDGVDYLVPNQNVLSNVVIVQRAPSLMPKSDTSFDSSV